MKKLTRVSLVVLVTLVPAASLLAHHSLGNFDTTKPVRVKGTIVQFYEVNPHSFLYLDEKLADGQIRRWAAEGPGIRQLDRTGFPKEVLKPGVEVEVCGYAPKENTIWQIATPNTVGQSSAGRLLNAETLTMPDGKQQSWGDYGFHNCFPPGYDDGHQRR